MQTLFTTAMTSSRVTVNPKMQSQNISKRSMKPVAVTRGGTTLKMGLSQQQSASLSGPGCIQPSIQLKSSEALKEASTGQVKTNLFQ